MKKLKENNTADLKVPDGTYKLKHEKTQYHVSVFFNHEGQMTAEDLLKRIIRKEAMQEMTENIHTSP